MKIVVLYEELAGYFMACITHFVEKYDAQVLIIRKETNPSAPFIFEEHTLIEILDRDTVSESEMYNHITIFEPDAVFCAGWSNKFYLKISRQFRPAIPVILGFDNWWKGSIKQRISVIVARTYLKNCFTNCFIPGSHQLEFARHLGFPPEKCRTGAYSCNTDFFSSVYDSTILSKKGQFPRRFIYSGRYTSVKGIVLLWTAFKRLRIELNTDWELWCIGTGDIPPIQQEGIRHFGFIQPSDLGTIMKDTGVFILPSNFEPWGVVVHEFATAGFPLLLSNKVGASEEFLREGQNGFSFEAGNIDAIISAMKSIICLSDEELLQMGDKSHKLALSVTPDSWSETLYELINAR